MINRSYFFAALLSLTALIAVPTLAQEMDVDQADSLDFESFHKDKKAAIKAWKDGDSEATKNAPVKAYEQAPASSATTAPSAVGTAAVPVAAEKAPAPTANKPIAGTAKQGQRYEIRERYTLTRSAKTPYSAFYVIEPLYKQAAQLCAHGWKKITERSEPVEQDFYLYYEIECL